MPMPFERIIGGGTDPFASIAAQRQFWGARNLATEEANVNRAAVAQQNVNDYFARIAAMRDAAAAREQNLQLGVDVEARRRAWEAQQLAAQQQEAERGRAFSAEQNAIGVQERRGEIAAAERMQEEQRKLAREKYAENLDLSGTSNAASYGAAMSRVEAAQKAIEAIDGQITTAQDELKAEQAKPKGKRNDLAILNAPKQIVELQKNKARAEAAKAQLETARVALESRILNQGFDINPDTGSISHPASPKTWTFRGAVKKAAAGILGPPVGFTEADANDMNDMTGTGWTGGAPVAPVAPAPAAAPAVKRLTMADAQAMLIEAGGDKDRARALAKQRGFVW